MEMVEALSNVLAYGVLLHVISMPLAGEARALWYPPRKF